MSIANPLEDAVVAATRPPAQPVSGLPEGSAIDTIGLDLDQIYDQYAVVDLVVRAARALGWRNVSAETSETSVTITFEKVQT